MEWALRVGVFLRLPSGSKHSQGWEPLLFSYMSPDTPCVILCAGADLPPSLFLWLIPSHPHPTQESLPSGTPPGKFSYRWAPRLLWACFHQSPVILHYDCWFTPYLSLIRSRVSFRKRFYHSSLYPWSQAGSGTLQASVSIG